MQPDTVIYLYQYFTSLNHSFMSELTLKFIRENIDNISLKTAAGFDKVVLDEFVCGKLFQ